VGRFFGMCMELLNVDEFVNPLPEEICDVVACASELLSGLYRTAYRETCRYSGLVCVDSENLPIRQMLNSSSCGTSSV